MNLKKKIENSIWGFIVGDAYGVPYEFKHYLQIPSNPKFIGYGTHNQPKGTWSDDTSLVLATMDSLYQRKSIDLDDIMSKYREWFFDSKYTSNNEVFDIGNTTKKAIKTGISGSSIDDNGNGSLMRMLPIAIWTYFNQEDKKYIEQYSSLTHSHNVSITACNQFNNFYHNCLDGNVLRKDMKISKPNDVNGYVAGTMQTALYCLSNSKTYTDSIKLAISLGGDTDTNAAVTGSLSGMSYKSIPLKNQIVGQKNAEIIINNFLSMFDL
jgi:ADP-ribosyl-[dinitrogen reductase] hydrolase